MGKNPAFLPSWVETVGAMIDAKACVTWSCDRCGTGGMVGLQAVRRKLGAEYSLVDKVSTCKVARCGGEVSFRYAAGPNTMTRPLKALREREAALKTVAKWEKG